MDVEGLIERAVLELRHEAGYRLTRAERDRLSELNKYLQWRIAIDGDSEELRVALWGDE